MPRQTPDLPSFPGKSFVACDSRPTGMASRAQPRAATYMRWKATRPVSAWFASAAGLEAGWFAGFSCEAGGFDEQPAIKIVATEIKKKVLILAPAFYLPSAARKVIILTRVSPWYTEQAKCTQIF